MWLGREDDAMSEWESLVEEAARSTTTPTAQYLLSTPLAADYLEEGLEKHRCYCNE